MNDPHQFVLHFSQILNLVSPNKDVTLQNLSI